MKSVCIFFFLLVSLKVNAQFEKQITIHFSDSSTISMDSIDYFLVRSSTSNFEKLNPVGNMLQFKGGEFSIDEFSIIAIKNNFRHSECVVFLDGTNVEMKLTIDDGIMFIDTIIGSSLMYDLDVVMKNFNTKVRDTEEELFNDLKNLFEDYVNNIFGKRLLDYLFQLSLGSKERLKELKLILDKQSKTMREHDYYNNYHNILYTLVDIGKINLSKLKLVDFEGKRVKIKHSDKNLLLDFWFVECPPCLEDHKLIIKSIESDSFPKDVVLIGINPINVSDDRRPKALSYIVESNISWRNYFAKPNYRKDSYVDKIGITSYPAYLLLNPKKEILLYANNYQDVVMYFTESLPLTETKKIK